jgi:glyoxylase-like metal-dependent hydrolase (beta-lactamase superfamily II)
MIGLKRIALLGMCLQGLTASVVSAQAATWTNERAIVQISEHVYRFGTTQNAMFVVTPAGIILVDGSCDNMQWLKTELQTRFKVPVKYVVLSHDHQSHICDTNVFADTAVGVGHVKIKPHIVREKRRSIVPEVMFEDTMELELGGIRVVLIYLGPTHSDNMIYVHVPSEGVLFAPDFARGRNILPDFRDLDIHNALKALRTLAYMPDVRIVLEGHDKSTTNQEVGFLAFHRYLQAINDRVLERMVAGKSLTEIRKEVTMADFKDYNQSPERVITHVETTYDYLWRYRDLQTPIRAPRD